MRFLRSFPVLGFLSVYLALVACNPVNKIDFQEIDQLILEYDPYQPLNYAVPISGTVLIKMKSGELIDAQKNNIYVATENIQFTGRKGKFETTQLPSKFSQNKVPVKLTIANKHEETFSNWDTLRLNYNAPIELTFSQKKAGDGADGSNGSQALLFRFGKSGLDGTSGQNGLNGVDLSIHCWKDSNMYFFHVQNLTTNETYFLQSTAAQLSIYAPGGTGGDGGNGGNGGDGKAAENTNNKIKYAGDGGDGGHGGNAGFGGNGGNVICYIHPSASELQRNISISVPAGVPGQPGRGGVGGKPGRNLEGLSPGRAGRNGQNGVTSAFGQRGTSSITLLAFDYLQLYR
jgi:hypothetical protein